ncbi:hypothetical protein IT407_02410 [Candidatus Uhrbacteria bacterium]|nr:hypothetical protein [Candidatus Uhrbacteria bacterium]
MKHLWIALILVSMLGFAQPTYASPQLTNKQRINIPAFPSSILKQYKAETARPEIERELTCSQTVTYRDWKVSESLHFREISILGRTSKFYPQFGTIEACAGRAALVLMGSYGHPGLTRTYVAITPERPDPRRQMSIQEYFGVGTPFKRITRVDGILQAAGRHELAVPGHFSGGNSTITIVKENGDIETILPPHYKDFTTIPQPEAGSIYEILFFKLRDGYGVQEKLRSSWYGRPWQCGPPCEQTPEQEYWATHEVTKYYRIRNGEKEYQEVASLPIEESGLTFPIVSFNEHDQGIYINYNDYQNNRLVGYRIHAIDTSIYGVKEGAVISQSNEQITFRYSLYLKSTGQTVQRWEATIQN